MGSFGWRRFHSLMGFWLLLYLILHLLTNSQAALWMGDSGANFVRMVNSLESLPFLPTLEIMLIAIPLLVHGLWGILRIFTARTNALPYSRNHAFTWQRITSWILLLGIAGHVLQMRFLDQPRVVEGMYQVIVTDDAQLAPLAAQVDARATPLESGMALVSGKTPGQAMLFMVRNTFKSLLFCALYSIFLLSAAFHAFNGLWTFLITWGLLLSYRAQLRAQWLIVAGFLLLTFWGFAAIWGSYYLA